VRYNANGSLDTSFGTGGKVTTPVGTGQDNADGVAVQPDGKIVVAGPSTVRGAHHFSGVRYKAGRSLRTRLCTRGKVTTPIGTYHDYGNAVAVQADGKIVVAGSSIIGSNNDITVVRYNADGSLDTTFSGDGKVITPVGASDDVAYDVAVQANGKIVLPGHSPNDSNHATPLMPS